MQKIKTEAFIEAFPFIKITIIGFVVGLIGLVLSNSLFWSVVFSIVLILDLVFIAFLIFCLIYYNIKKNVVNHKKPLVNQNQSSLMARLTKNDHLKYSELNKKPNDNVNDWEDISQKEEHYNYPEQNICVDMTLSIRKRTIDILPTYDYSEKATENYVSRLVRSKIFIDNSTSEIKRLTNGRINTAIHNSGELFSNEEKKELGIKYRGHLGKNFYDILRDKSDAKAAIEMYRELQKISLQEYFELQENDRHLFLANNDREEAISGGYSIGVWCCLKSTECEFESHRTLNRKRFNIIEGMIDPEYNVDSIRIFPGEEYGCKCRISEYVR
ncbi:MAG: G-protein coupled receptor [Burkholderiales bacterium]|nr:G-protein coupled receptor [Burkholderiales bacterium]